MKSDSPAPLFGWFLNYTEAAQSGRMYYYMEGFCQPLWWFHTYSIETPRSSHLSAWNRRSYGNGFLYKPPPFKSRNSTATVSLSCDLKKKTTKKTKNMPNTTDAYLIFFFFFLCNSRSVETTVPPSSLQLTGTRLGSFITLVSKC